MLNLLRFREVADYANFPASAPTGVITGRAADELYAAHFALFEATGGAISLLAMRARELRVNPMRGADLNPTQVHKRQVMQCQHGIVGEERVVTDAEHRFDQFLPAGPWDAV